LFRVRGAYRLRGEIMANETLIDEPLKVGEVTPIPSEIDAKLKVVAGTDTGQLTYLESPITLIGREEECHITLDDARVSNRHAMVYFASGEFRVRDLNSTNGSLLNGSPLSECVFTDGDDLRVGKTVLRLIVDFRDE